MGVPSSEQAGIQRTVATLSVEDLKQDYNTSMKMVERLADKAQREVLNPEDLKDFHLHVEFMVCAESRMSGAGWLTRTRRRMQILSTSFRDAA